MAHALIIEDEELVASTMIDMLSGMGLRSFSIAATEADAVREAQRARPALVTVDVQLRQGSGIHAIERIRRDLGSVPVLYVTATPLAVAHDPDAIALFKPFTRDALANAVGYLLQAPEGPSPA